MTTQRGQGGVSLSFCELSLVFLLLWVYKVLYLLKKKIKKEKEKKQNSKKVREREKTLS